LAGRSCHEPDASVKDGGHVCPWQPGAGWRAPTACTWDIADAAGHITSAVTRNVYRHQLADRLTKASAAMDAIFSPA